MKNISIGLLAVIGVFLLILDSTVSAHDKKKYYNHSQNMNISANTDCDVNVTNFEIDNDRITLENVNHEEIIITAEDELYHNGDKVDLTGEQSYLVRHYAKGVRGVTDEIIIIVKDGVGLGVKAATMAIGAILGDEDKDFSEFEVKINALATRIEKRIDTKKFSSHGMEHEFESEIEEVVEDAVATIAPRLMAKVMSAAMSGDEEEVRRLEARAEGIEEKIETMIEPEVRLIEARAEALCKHVKKLNDIEDEMVESDLAMMDIIEIR